jgi:hypothetical protein
MDVKKLESILKEEGILFLTYGSFFSQPLIVGMMEALEKEAEELELSMKLAGNIFTIFIELAQNIMNYSKKVEKKGEDVKGLILVGKTKEGKYYILSQNVVDAKDKEVIEKKLSQIKGLSKEEIKKLYREARKAGKDKHEKGGGIGFLEIAKRSEDIEYTLTPIEDDKYIFQIKVVVAE